jgi:Major Facilitator Superfamily
MRLRTVNASAGLARAAGGNHWISRRIESLLPPAGPLRRYSAIGLIDATGTGLFATVSTLFFTRVVELPAGQVGLGLSLAGLAALLGAIPLGSLGDRLGHRRVWITVTLAEALAYACYPLVRSFAEFAAAVTLAALGQVGSSPIRAAYLAQLAGEADRVRARAYNQAVYNAGWAVGVLGAGAALAIGSRGSYLVLVLADAASYAICAALLLTLPAPVRPARADNPESRPRRSVLRDRRFLTVSLLNGLLMTYGSILTVALPLWIVERTDAPAWMVAALFGLNTFLAITLCVRLSRGAQSLVGAARAIRRAGLALFAACLIFAISGSVGPALAIAALAAGCVLLTVGELLQSAGAWGISYGLARPERQGEYLGAFSMGTRVYDTVGPVLVVGLVRGLGLAGWVLMGALLLGISLTLTPAVRAAEWQCPAQPGGHEPG